MVNSSLVSSTGGVEETLIHFLKINEEKLIQRTVNVQQKAGVYLRGEYKSKKNAQLL